MIDDLKTQADACESVITLRRRLHEAADRIAELERENKRLRAGNDRHNDIVGEEVNARAITEAKCERLATMLRRFSLAAQTTGGTAGPDHGLQAAIGDTERVLRYTGMVRTALATDQQGERGDEGVVDLRVVAQAYEFALSVEQEDGSVQIWGLTAGDQGYEPTGIVISADCIGHLKRGTP